MGEISIQKPGLFTSIQDQGRVGFRKYGVPLSGAMDRQSALIANLLVNNPAEAAVLEITLVGPTLVFHQDCIASLTGALLSPMLNHTPAKMNSPMAITAGQTLTFGKPQQGVRAYLAIRGGIKADVILGSASQYYPVTAKAKLDKGDLVTFYDHDIKGLPNAAIKSPKRLAPLTVIQAFPGPEFDLLSNTQKGVLLKSSIIGDNNRMGYQLIPQGDLSNQLSIITSPVVPGTVQLTPSGKLIVLMRDAQVTGGYPRVLQITEQDLNYLAQVETGKRIKLQIR